MTFRGNLLTLYFVLSFLSYGYVASLRIAPVYSSKPTQIHSHSTNSQSSRISQANYRKNSKLYARLAKNEGVSNQQSEEEDGPVRIPIDGLVGGERGLKLFDSPLEVYDPLKNTDDLPGKDGSEEKMSAIMQRIEDRVKQMKESGEWEREGDSFGKNPLANQPLYETMLMQLKACKPFESFDELLLTYSLVIFTSLTLSAYLLVLKFNLNSFMEWFVGADIDSDFMNEIMRNISA